jgi:hypothetical protein
VNVLARKGKRDRAHEGPCSIILGLIGVKNFVTSSSGRGGEMRDWQNEEVVLRRVSALFIDEDGD